jgi:hypothetical protein
MILGGAIQTLTAGAPPIRPVGLTAIRKFKTRSLTRCDRAFTTLTRRRNLIRFWNVRWPHLFAWLSIQATGCGYCNRRFWA